MEVEAAGVEHRLGRIAAVRRLQLRDVAVVVDVAHADVRPSRLPVPDRRHAPVADDRVGHLVGAAAVAPAVAEGQLPDAVHHQAVRQVGVLVSLFVVGVGLVPLGHLLLEVRPRVAGEHGVAAAEAPLEPELRRIERARAVIAAHVDVAELRIRPEEILALRRGVVQRLSGNQAGKRIGHVRGERIDHRVVAHVAGREDTAAARALMLTSVLRS